MLDRVGLSDDVGRIAVAAGRFAGRGERVEAVVPAEPAAGARIYLVAFSADAARSWLALDGEAEPVTDRERVRDAVSIAALVEVAEDGAPDGSLPAEPRLASPTYLDELGAAVGPQFGVAVQEALGAVEELAKDVEANYKLELT
jgi:hypothetical protein